VKLRELKKQLHEKDLLIAKQNEIIEALRKEITALRSEIADLKRQLGLDSSNSGKPPSSDGLKKPPCRTQSLREKSGKKSGGQPGHKGSTLQRVETPDRIEKVEVKSCPHCQTCLAQVPVSGVQKQQVYEIPVIKAQVVEYENEVKVCPNCHKTVVARKDGISSAPVQYGPSINAMAAYFSVQNLLPENRIVQLMQDLFNLPISEATIESMVERCATTVAPVAAVIAAHFRHSPISCLDESGIRVCGKLEWVHTSSNDKFTYYRISEKRGDVPQNLQGIAVHDHFQSYYSKMPNVQHALCNAHHLRELKAAAEMDKERWAKKMSHLLRVGLRLTYDYPNGVPQNLVLKFRRLYGLVLAMGFVYHEKLDPLPQKKRGKAKRRPGLNLLLRLQNCIDDVLRFLDNPDVPFTNNLAEQSLRMVKVKNKISGAFRTRAGAERFLIIRSYAATAKKHGINVFHALSAASIGKPIFFC